MIGINKNMEEQNQKHKPMLNEDPPPLVLLLLLLLLNDFGVNWKDEEDEEEF